MQAANLPTDGLARHTIDGVAEGEALAGELLELADPPTAVVCASDPLALGAWRRRQLAVIGFDDTQVAQAVGLSSVRQPLAEAAAQCLGNISLLLGDREPHDGDDADPSTRQVLLEPQLIVRDSG